MSNEDIVLARLEKYNKPVKTKHLSPRVNLERPDLVEALNTLEKAKKIKWFNPLTELYEKKIGAVSIWIKDPQPKNNVCGWVKI